MRSREWLVGQPTVSESFSVNRKVQVHKFTLLTWPPIRIEEIKSSPAVFSALSLNRSGTTFGFVRQTSDTPGDAYVASVADFTPVQISRVNADVKMPALGRTEVIRWKSKDGKDIEGLLTYPVGYQAGQRVPMILNVHGGPAGVFQQTFLWWARRLSARYFCRTRLCDPATKSARVERIRD